MSHFPDASSCSHKKALKCLNIDVSAQINGYCKDIHSTFKEYLNSGDRMSKTCFLLRAHNDRKSHETIKTQILTKCMQI